MPLTTKNQNEIYALPNKQWIFINRWIGDILNAGKATYKSDPGSFPPAFPNAISDATAWTTTTFPAIVSLSSNINSYAKQAIAGWQSIQQQVEALPASGPVPAALQTDIKNELTALKSATDSICALLPPIVSAIEQMQNNYNTIGSQWMKNQNGYEGFCGLIMFSDYLPIPPGAKASNIASIILGIPQMFNNNLSILKGAWEGLEADLTSIAKQSVDVTLPFITSLDIKNAISDWQAIENDQVGFDLVQKEATALWKSPDEKTPWVTTGT